ncbi:hypothetical protein RRSWK_00900 [Rhodopirellula sp. SWK7]|nr:hypothetical protein RRSWK_00900 [Rhodopirellula sp. SWK7]
MRGLELNDENEMWAFTLRCERRYRLSNSALIRTIDSFGVVGRGDETVVQRIVRICGEVASRRVIVPHSSLGEHFLGADEKTHRCE